MEQSLLRLRAHRHLIANQDHTCTGRDAAGRSGQCFSIVPGLSRTSEHDEAGGYSGQTVMTLPSRMTTCRANGPSPFQVAEAS